MKTITDHELSEIANDWAKEIPYENIGIRTAFAAGYKRAMEEYKSQGLPSDEDIKNTATDYANESDSRIDREVIRDSYIVGAK